jgi:protein-arginine kinase activator protein McsA
MLLDVSKNLLSKMFVLAQLPDNIYNLSMICEYCLAMIDYNELGPNDKDQWQELLTQHIIRPADSFQDFNNKFSLSVSEECSKICQSLRKKERGYIVDCFTNFAEKYQPQSLTARRKEGNTPKHAKP